MHPISLPRDPSTAADLDDNDTSQAVDPNLVSSATAGNDDSTSRDDDGIVSVNQTRQTGNRKAKGLFILACLVLIAGALAWFGQHYLTSIKDAARSASAGKKARTAEDENLLNPEGSKAPRPESRVGADSGRPPGPPPGAAATAATPPSTATSAPATATAELPTGCESIPGGRPLRGGDGKVMLNPQGRALCVGPDGQVIAIPPIQPAGGATTAGAPAGTGGAQAAKPASRFGGSLFADGGEPSAARNVQGLGGTEAAGQPAQPGGAGTPTPQRPNQTQQTVDLLRALMPGSNAQAAQPPANQQSPAGGGPGVGQTQAMTQQPQQPAGSVGGMLSSSSTPVARASRIPNQDLMLPKARQIDCVLTTRIVNEVPGFTSCVLTHDLYSSNGRVKLLEKGSALDGEYGNTTQNGQRSLMVTWDRIRTPDGVQVDLRSPGTDPLGTSGIPGYLDNRWPERIGTALLISFMGDLIKLEIAKQAARSSNGGTVVLQPGGGYQGTTDTTQHLAEQILRQTVNTRPTLYINEGQRIAIYVARDLDFSQVYALRMAGGGGALRIE